MKTPDKTKTFHGNTFFLQRFYFLPHIQFLHPKMNFGNVIFRKPSIYWIFGSSKIIKSDTPNAYPHLWDVDAEANLVSNVSISETFTFNI